MTTLNGYSRIVVTRLGGVVAYRAERRPEVGQVIETYAGPALVIGVTPSAGAPESTDVIAETLTGAMVFHRIDPTTEERNP